MNYLGGWLFVLLFVALAAWMGHRHEEGIRCFVNDAGKRICVDPHPEYYDGP
jgi:hypothetical protein